MAELSVTLHDRDDSGKFEIGPSGITGTRIADCDWDDVFTAVRELMGETVIRRGVIFHVLPKKFPSIPSCFVESIVVEPHGTTKTKTWDEGPAYELAKLTITYRTPEWDEAEPFAITSLDYSAEILSVPVRVVDHIDPNPPAIGTDPDMTIRHIPEVVDSDGNVTELPTVEITNRKDKEKAGAPAVNQKRKERIVKRHIRIPTIAFTIDVPRFVNPPTPAIYEKIGKINHLPFAGGDGGTVLFDGANVQTEYIPAANLLMQKASKVQYKFLYQRHGWNNWLHPETLKWVPANAVGALNPPYEFTVFDGLMPHLVGRPHVFMDVEFADRAVPTEFKKAKEILISAKGAGC